MLRLLGFTQIFRKRGSIERALLDERLPRRTWKTLGVVRPCYLIEQLAKLNNISPDSLLDQVSANLAIAPKSTIYAPTRALVNLTGYSSELLHSLSVVPQEAPSSPFGYSIVIADPDTISTDDFLAQGIPVYLGLGSEIDAAWSKFFAEPVTHQHGSSVVRQAKRISQEILFNILNNLLEQAARCNATELFIGHPDETQYEFLVNSTHYRGKIKPELYRNLVSSFAAGERRVRVPTFSKMIRNIYISLTRDGTRPVLLVSWDLIETNNSHELEPNEIDFVTSEEKDTPDPANLHATSKTTSVTLPDLPQTPKSKPAPLSLLNSEASILSAKPLERRTVLLIDDDDRFRLILRRILESKGWSVTEQSSAISALAHIKNHPDEFQLIISDVHMPHMDGVEFLKSIKEMAHAAPILMLTSDENSLLQAELALLGADAFVRKQDDPRVLLAWCFNLLTKRKQEHGITQ